MARLESHRQARGAVFLGVQGVGKAVLLNEVRRQATTRGWIIAKVEASSGYPFRSAIAQGFNASLRSATGRHQPATLSRSLAVFKAFSLASSPDGSLALGIDVEASRGIADTGNLEIDLTELLGELGSTAASLNIGVALIVDELHALGDNEIASLCGALHDTAQHGLPVTMFGAGLPNLGSALSNAKSYAEHLFDIKTIEPFTDEVAAEMLTAATTTERVGWTGDAIRIVLNAARGYPYFLQVYGKHVWDFALASPITGSDARAGVAAGEAYLARSFFGSRWNRTTPAQQQYLTVLANLETNENRASTSLIAESLNRSLGTLSSTRDQLLRKSLIYAPDRGTVAFTTPGMSTFVRAKQKTVTGE